MAIFLNSFTPLATNKFGRLVSGKYKIPLFIDGSCRREPDFENPNPAITQLCRPGKLVTRLNKGDIIIYITKIGKYGTKIEGWRLISILEVVEIKQSHKEACDYYLKKGIPVSQNIICSKTKPFPLDKTHKINDNVRVYSDENEIIRRWNAGYEIRARRYPEVAITKIWNNVLFLNTPPNIDRNTMTYIFGRIPGTQTPPEITNNEWKKFRQKMNI